MPAWLGNAWENSRNSFWFIPAILVLAAVLLASGLLVVDARLVPGLSEGTPWPFGGTAEAARTLLGAVATSVLSVAAIAFSVTMVAVEQAASRLTPRVLQTFTSDHRNQVVLGTLLATFTYALLVMRQVRAPDGQIAAFVPSLSISVAIALALVSIGMLVFFIHHSVRFLDVSFVLSAIRQEFAAQAARLPEPGGGAPLDPPRAADLVPGTAGERRGVESTIRNQAGGYLRRVNRKPLMEAAGQEAAFVWLPNEVGVWVARGAPLARIWAPGPLGDRARRAVAAAFALDRERSVEQDPLFAIQQAVDIAVKALSPGINDPTTAEECVLAIGDMLALIADRPLPHPLAPAGDGRPPCLFETPRFEDYADVAFAQIRRAARTDLRVTMTLLDVLGTLRERAGSEERVRVLTRHVEEVLAALPLGSHTDTERRAIADRGLEVLAGRAPRGQELRRGA